MNFREAVINDINQLFILEQKVVEAERPYNASIKKGKPIYYDMLNLISDKYSYLIVAEEDGEIVGTGYAQIQLSKTSLQHENHAYLGFMYVSPRCRGKGLNKEIIDRLISWSKKQGVNDHYLEVYSGNSSAIRAYEKKGFKPCLIEMKLNTE
ncbi:MAG: GNAT family N-acetyltransferase [Alcanivoracaceae bacterium]|nr:GNAT family N-acetyltransferase [Alcanivoracaceae bacterium]